MHIKVSHEHHAGTKARPTGCSVLFEAEDTDTHAVLAALETHQRGEHANRPEHPMKPVLDAVVPILLPLIQEVVGKPADKVEK